MRTPDGPATLHLRRTTEDLLARAFGPGREWALAAAAGLAGLLDQPEPFTTDHRLVAEWARTLRGVRLPRTGLVFESLIPAIVGQKVTGVESRRSMDRIVRRFSEPAPGPVEGLFLPPDPDRLAEAPYHLFHPLGVEQRRADTIRRAAARARWVEEASSRPAAEAEQRLRVIAGVGQWTAAKAVALSHGHPDLVPLGDYHLPNVVAWNLAGEARATDVRMLELLEPFRPQRGRVIRWLQAAGEKPPAFGPRMPLRELAPI